MLAFHRPLSYPQLARTREVGLVGGGSAAVYCTEIDQERHSLAEGWLATGESCPIRVWIAVNGFIEHTFGRATYCRCFFVFVVLTEN